MSFASRYISEVEGGKGFVGGAKEAAKGTAKDFKKQFSKENLVQSMFGGDDIISAALRNKFGVKGPGKGKKDKTPSPAGGDGQGISSEGISFLKIIAKESMAIPSMARDTNVLRQNLQKLVKIFGGKAATKRDSVEEREKDLSFFAQEDAKEAEIEAQRQTAGSEETTPTPEKKEEKGEGLLDSIMKMFSGGFMEGIKKLFNKKMLMKVFSKVFLPIAIIATLFSGITAGFKKYQETGSFSEAIVAGLGGMLNFLTFGLFGEDTLKSLFDSISNFFQPITDTISKIFTGIKDFVKGLFGNIVDVKDDAPAKADDVKPTMPDPKQFAQSMAKASGASDEKSADLGGIFDAVGKGDVEGLFGKAQEFAAKYPEPPASETSPTPLSSEGVPLDQAQRNYELNKSLTGQASQALGVPLEAPAPPKPAPAPAASKPTPAPASKPQNQTELDEAKAKEKEIYKEQRRINSELRDIKKRIQDPAVSEAEKDQLTDRGVELESQYNRLEREGIKQNQLVQTLEAEAKAEGKVPSAQGTVSSSGGASSSGSVGGGGGGGGGSGGGGGGGGGSSGGGGSLSAGGSAPSGSEMSQSSSQVAEGQRMESAADAGSVVNSPTTNNSTAAPDGAKPPVADAYNEDFARLLART
jgi:hypothetical protein